MTFSQMCCRVAGWESMSIEERSLIRQHFHPNEVPALTFSQAAKLLHNFGLADNGDGRNLLERKTNDVR